MMIRNIKHVVTNITVITARPGERESRDEKYLTHLKQKLIKLQCSNKLGMNLNFTCLSTKLKIMITTTTTKEKKGGK